MSIALKPINKNGIQLYPYNTYKRWVVTNSNYRDDSKLVSILKGISPLYNEKIEVSGSNGELDNTNSNSTPFLSNKFQKNVWSSLNQTFFKYRSHNERDLYVSASVFSIPFNRLGDGVKPGSIIVSDNSSGYNVHLVDRKIDEYHGYLVDTNLDTGSYVPFGNLIGYWGFNDEVIPRYTSLDNYIEDRSGYTHHGRGVDIDYVLGTSTVGLVEEPSGTKLNFNGSTSYVMVKHNKQLDFFKDSNFAISVWVNLPTEQNDYLLPTNSIISKNGVYEEYYLDKKHKQQVRYRTIESPAYPFDISVYNQTDANDGKVRLSLSDGLQTTEATSSTLINDNMDHHIVYNRTGSLLELWVDGIKESSSSVDVRNPIWNDRYLMMGSKFISENTIDDNSERMSLSGSLDEVRIYNRGLTEDEIVGLSNNDYNTGSAYQSDIVGEVFYKNGLMVVTDPRPLYKNIWVGETGDWDYGVTNGFETEWKSTKQLHEMSVLCEVGANEFNVTQNPSARMNNDINNKFLQPFTTGSDFMPYYTTIGLYNDTGDLIAVGKLGSPIKNRTDVDVTIQVRMDLDGAFGTPNTGSLPEEDTNQYLEQTKNGNYILRF